MDETGRAWASSGAATMTPRAVAKRNAFMDMPFLRGTSRRCRITSHLPSTCNRSQANDTAFCALCTPTPFSLNASLRNPCEPARICPRAAVVPHSRVEFELKNRGDGRHGSRQGSPKEHRRGTRRRPRTAQRGTVHCLRAGPPSAGQRQCPHSRRAGGALLRGWDRPHVSVVGLGAPSVVVSICSPATIHPDANGAACS